MTRQEECKTSWIVCIERREDNQELRHEESLKVKRMEGKARESITTNRNIKS